MECYSNIAATFLIIFAILHWNFVHFCNILMLYYIFNFTNLISDIKKEDFWTEIYFSFSLFYLLIYVV